MRVGQCLHPIHLHARSCRVFPCILSSFVLPGFRTVKQSKESDLMSFNLSGTFWFLSSLCLDLCLGSVFNPCPSGFGHRKCTTAHHTAWPWFQLHSLPKCYIQFANPSLVLCFASPRPFTNSVFGCAYCPPAIVVHVPWEHRATLTESWFSVKQLLSFFHTLQQFLETENSTPAHKNRHSETEHVPLERSGYGAEPRLCTLNLLACTRGLLG